MAKNRNALELLLELIDTETARYMLEDVRTAERRGPQLYNAIDKFLSRHKFKLGSLEANEADLGELQAALDAFNELALEDAQGVQH